VEVTRLLEGEAEKRIGFTLGQTNHRQRQQTGDKQLLHRNRLLQMSCTQDLSHHGNFC
jgi:hypothetical protein